MSEFETYRSTERVRARTVEAGEPVQTSNVGGMDAPADGYLVVWDKDGRTQWYPAALFEALYEVEVKAQKSAVSKR